MPEKLIVTFIKAHTPYIPGDTTVLDAEEAKELSDNGFVRIGGIPVSESKEIEPLAGENIKGEKYHYGKINVIIPTKDKDYQTFKDDSGLVESINVVCRTFNKKNGGFAKACNDGARMYEDLGEFILFLNDDVEIGEHFFSDLLKPFEDEKVAIVGCGASAKKWGVNGAVMCIRREIFEKVGGFDDRYFFMWEDRDLCVNVEKRGYKIAISEAKANHRGGASTKVTEFYETNYKAGKEYFDKKWGNDRRIIGAMTLGNEEGRYLEMVVADLFDRDLIDDLVMVLDAPTDRTPEIVAELAEKYPIKIYHHNFKLFGTAQNVLRKRLIEYGISLNPYGFLTPDADEIFDPEFNREAIYELLETGVGWDFKVAHLWGDDKHVRVDGMWGNQKNIRLFRYLPGDRQDFSPKPIHCGSGPWYAYKKRQQAPFLFLHYGYLKKKDIKTKVERYKEHDPAGLYETIDWYRDMEKEGEIIEYNKNFYVK